MPKKMKKIALCYDFDGTLCSGYMQDQKLLHDCKIEPKIFGLKLQITQEKITATLLLLI
jgi:hypothetical protein